jgi:uncharacterized membrane protein
MSNKPKYIPLRSMPPRIHDYIINIQAEIRKKTGEFISLERVIYRIINSVMEDEKKNSIFAT